MDIISGFFSDFYILSALSNRNKEVSLTELFLIPIKIENSLKNIHVPFLLKTCLKE